MSTTTERFWAKVDKRGPDECWPWTAGLFPAGYGAIHVAPRRMGLAHRVSYEMHVGSLAAGTVLMHHCDNRKCVNPAHLRIGTHSDNHADMVAKQRQAKGRALPQAKLTPEKVRVIRSSSVSVRKLAAAFGVSSSAIGAVRNGRNWRHVI